MINEQKTPKTFKNYKLKQKWFKTLSKTFMHSIYDRKSFLKKRTVFTQRFLTIISINENGMPIYKTIKF